MVPGCEEEATDGCDDEEQVRYGVPELCSSVRMRGGTSCDMRSEGDV